MDVLVRLLGTYEQYEAEVKGQYHRPNVSHLCLSYIVFRRLYWIFIEVRNKLSKKFRKSKEHAKSQKVNLKFADGPPSVLRLA